MKKRLFLTSCIAVSFVAPAMAETFPTNGLMRENKTYDNAATETNMDGVYEGTVDAVAEYTTIDYILTAGKYLPADSETITTCPAGSFCAGGDTVQYNQSSAQGIETCPTGYASSAAGASRNTQCYRQCSGNVTIAHATGVTGNDYYGNGIDTCEPTACEHGWHPRSGIITIRGVELGYVNNAGQAQEQATALGISDKNTWAVNYGDRGILKGRAQCSSRAGTYPWKDHTYNVIDSNFTATLTSTVGSYCYCKLDSYTPLNGSEQGLSSPWVFYGGYSYISSSSCASQCIEYCAYYMYNKDSGSLTFRAAMLGSVTDFQPMPASCEVNTIMINWSDADAADISANNAGTTTYGSDVRTPVKAQTIKGKAFKGWRFSKPTVQSCDHITDEIICDSISNCAWKEIGWEEGEACVQSCESIIDAETCEDRESVFLRRSSGYMHFEKCSWNETNESCESYTYADQ